MRWLNKAFHRPAEPEPFTMGFVSSLPDRIETFEMRWLNKAFHRPAGPEPFTVGVLQRWRNADKSR